MKLLKPLLIGTLFSILTSCTVNTDKSPTNTPPAVLPPTTEAASAGGVDGGGGKAVLCGSKLMTLDLYEARANGILFSGSTGSLDSDLKKFGTEWVKHISESLNALNDPKLEDKVLKEFNDSIISHFKDVPTGTRLPITNDATIPSLPENCSVVQVAVYAQDGTIYRDAEYWSQLDVIEQTALIVHEWVYHRARKYGAVNSDESRKALGLIFSGNNPEPLLSPLWNANKKIWCGAGIQGTTQELYEIYGVDETQNGQVGVGLYFRAFKSAYLTSRVSTFLPGVTLDQIINRQFTAFNVMAKNDLLNKTWNFEFSPNPQSLGYTLRAYSIGQVQPPYSSGFCRFE